MLELWSPHGKIQDDNLCSTKRNPHSGAWQNLMAFYTRKGDKGDTGTFGCDQRMSKSSAVAEALGTLDELNAFLGVCKTNTSADEPFFETYRFADMLDWIQQNLFIVQAELAGAEKTIAEEKVRHMEEVIDTIEGELPPIKSFFVSGGTEFAAKLDFARTISRRAERRVIAAAEEGRVSVGEQSRAFLNRLSSLLYAMARIANHRAGKTEEKPTYQ